MRLEILNEIYKLRSAYFGALTEAVDIPPSDLSAILSNLIHEGYLFPVASSNGPYNLTNRGREYRLELEKLAEEKHQQQAFEESVKRAEKKARNRGCVIEMLKVIIELAFVLLAAVLAEYTGVFHRLFAFFQ